ncbi:MAG: heparinase II/III family protein [Alistipes sp.]|nr:heparinase II/III family protein [Candidatus Alistipes equi]
MIRKVVCFLFILCFFVPVTKADMKNLECKKGHPRIILRDGDINHLREVISTDIFLKEYHDRIVRKSEKLLHAQPQKRVKTGKRLLSVSRRVLEMTTHCSYMYLMTGDMSYARRAEREMLAAAQFTDWNPSHFLDVGEMTAALAIGYDWLYDVLSPASRKIISQAIIDKGLHATTNPTHQKFYKAKHNWNQVCNAGLVMGAIAVYELLPTDASVQILKSVKSNPLAQECYGPNGVYPEGFAYWDYGTTFEVMLIESLRSALGTSFDLEKAPGFLESAHFMQAMVGPTGAVFNYSDCNSISSSSNPLLYWFANELGDTSVLWWERNMRKAGSHQVDSSRILPVILILAQRLNLKDVPCPKYKLWYGKGEQSIAIYRSDWTSRLATYLALKGGSASINHAHMDAGSFVYDCNGVRWAEDAGKQDYYLMEKEGLNIWSRTQESDRWKIFRYNNTSHNTLTVNDKKHIMKGFAKITRAEELRNGCKAEVDMTPIFSDLRSAKRTFKLKDDGRLCILDELTALNEQCDVKWLMWTRADVKVLNETTVALSRSGKRILLKASGASNIRACILKNTPPQSYDENNGNSVRVCFQMDIKPNKSARMKVEFIPD